MFSKITDTVYRPERPILIWDGACPFCEYWVSRWRKITGKKVDYIPYQKIHTEIPDIQQSDFQQAARLIDQEGKVYNGPEAAYWCLRFGKRWTGLLAKYGKFSWFRFLSDKAYDYIAHHRTFLLKVTWLLWGKDPETTRPYWIFYFSIILGAILAVVFLRSGIL